MSVPAMIELLHDEMEARGWTSRDVAVRMVARYDVQVRELEIDLMLACRDDPHVVVGDDTCAALDLVLGVSKGFCRGLVDSPPIVEVEEPTP